MIENHGFGTNLGVFDPVFDHRRDLVVRRWSERGEQTKYLGTNNGPAVMITRFTGHG